MVNQIQFRKASRLDHVCYDIRGPVMKRAKVLEDSGHPIIKLNIGNVAAFGLTPPEEVIQDVVRNLHSAAGYIDSKGLFQARKAIMQYAQTKQIPDVSVDDIYIGNGVSELIVMAMSAMLNAGDEVLVPAPDYPLWTASVTLAGGNAVHYLCDEQADWMPDIDDIERKITKQTKALVIINPNNPTGAVYPDECLLQIVNLARKYGLMILADEIYDKILYDGTSHTSIASLAPDVFCLTFNGLSKNYRACGYRSGWMIVSGNKKIAQDYLDGLDMLASMRLCANVPTQFAIQTALGGTQSIDALVQAGGRLYRQRNLAYDMITSIPGVSCVKPKGAMYLFPKLDSRRFRIENDEKFVLNLLEEERVLLVQGTGFHWINHDHFRLVFLPHEDDLKEAIERIARFLDRLASKN
jgi:alanine-synthesizing transaminase